MLGVSAPLHSISSGLNEFLCWNSLATPLVGGQRRGTSMVICSFSSCEESFSGPFYISVGGYFCCLFWFQADTGHLESTLSANEQVCCWLSIQPSSWGPGMGLLLDRQSLPTSYCPQEHVSVLGIFSSLSVGFSLMMLDAAVLLCVGF